MALYIGDYVMTKRTFLALIFIGIIAGLVGFILTELMHTMQHLAYGYSSDDFQSFLGGISAASPERRLGALLATGFVGGLGWFLIHRYGSPLISIGQAVKDGSKQLPTITTCFHAALQMITVGMGSPLGREVAPREMSAALSNPIRKILHTDPKDQSLLLACAAGAGLAAVYNAPLAATIFTLETLLLSWDRKSLISALLTCGIATIVIRLTLGSVVQYEMEPALFSFTSIPWTLAFSPLLALAVLLFKKSDLSLPQLNPKSPWAILLSILAFGLIGLLAIWYPSILGNGKPGNQLTFSSLISAQYALELFTAKWGAILLATLAGAYGGRLTPSMMLGSTLGLASAVLWNTSLISLGIDPSYGVNVGGAAFIGAALYLGVNQKMPLTACVFLIELSHWSIEYAFPICLGMGLSLACFHWGKGYILKEN